jgi:endo-beta-N-acetylglucosaminidase D
LVTSQTQRKLWLISSSVSKWRSKEAAMALKTQTKSQQTSTDCLFLSSTPANICPESSTGTGQIPAYFNAWAYIVVMKFWLKVSSKSRFCTTVAVLTKY